MVVIDSEYFVDEECRIRRPIGPCFDSNSHVTAAEAEMRPSRWWLTWIIGVSRDDVN